MQADSPVNKKTEWTSEAFNSHLESEVMKLVSSGFASTEEV